MNIKKILLAAMLGLLVTAELSIFALTDFDYEEEIYDIYPEENIYPPSGTPEESMPSSSAPPAPTSKPIMRILPVSPICGGRGFEPALRDVTSEQDALKVLKIGKDPVSETAKENCLMYLTTLATSRSGAQRILSSCDATKSPNDNYKKLQLLWHPDKHHGDKEFATQITTILNQAKMKMTEPVEETPATPSETTPTQATETENLKRYAEGDWKSPKKQAQAERAAAKRKMKFGEN